MVRGRRVIRPRDRVRGVVQDMVHDVVTDVAVGACPRRVATSPTRGDATSTTTVVNHASRNYLGMPACEVSDMTDTALGQKETTKEATGTWQPRLVGFLCNWCSFAGADMAGTSRLDYPSAIRIIRVPCTGRVDPLFVAKAFQQGADGVLVAGCHPGDCHYAEGNYFMRRRYAMLRRLLTYLGIEEGRFHLEWVSASEGKKFARVITEFTARVTALGPRRREASPAAGAVGGL